MIIANCNVAKLHNEFVNVGINPSPVFELENGDGKFTFPKGTDMDLVQQIIDSHDPTPLPKPLSEIEQLKLDQAKANAELAQLIMAMSGGM